MLKFETEEADFLKVAQQPATVTLSVQAGVPGKKVLIKCAWSELTHLYRP